MDYHKKKEKKAAIKFIKDETVTSNFDVYKSHTVHVPSGEPPGSLSRPPAKRKAGVVRPITQGKLLKAGGPVGGLLFSWILWTEGLYRNNHRHRDLNLSPSLFRAHLQLPFDNLRLYHLLSEKTKHLRLPLPVLTCLHHLRHCDRKYRYTELNLHSKGKKER